MTAFPADSAEAVPSEAPCAVLDVLGLLFQISAIAGAIDLNVDDAQGDCSCGCGAVETLSRCRHLARAIEGIAERSITALDAVPASARPAGA